MEISNKEEILELKARIEELETQLKKKNEAETYLHVLHDTALSIMNRLDLNDILTIIIERACQLVGIENGFIYLLEPDESVMKLKAAIGPSKAFVSDLIYPEEGIVGKIWKIGKPLIIKNYKEWEGMRPQFLSLDFDSVIGIPLISHEKVIGVFGFTYNKNDEIPFDYIMELFKGFAQLTVIALDNSKLFSYLQEEFNEVIRVESELRESENRYRTLFESANHGIFLSDENQIVECNKKMAAMLGYTEDQVVGRNICEFSSEEQYNGEKSNEYWNELLIGALGGNNEVIEWHFLSSEKKVFNTELSLNRVPLQGKLFILGLVSDITEKKKIQEELKRQQILLSDIFTRVQEGIVMVDELMSIVYCNPGFDSIFEESIENLTGKNILEFVDDEYKNEIENAINEKIMGKVTSGEISITTGKGNKKYINLSASPYFDKENKYIGAFAAVFDITDRKLKEENLKISEDKFSKVFYSISDSILIITLNEGLILDINDSSCKFIGLKREEIINKNITDLKFRDIRFHNKISELIKNAKKVRNLECSFRNYKNENRLFLISADIIEIADKKCLMCISRDITEIRNLQEDLQKSKSLESVGILAGGIAHNFNNILTGILGNISLAKLYAKPGDKIFERLKEAEKNSLKAKDLTNQLITFSKGGKPQKTVSPVVDIINRTTQKVLSGFNINFELTAHPDLWEVELDESQFINALSNIILNAKDSMEGYQEKIIKINIENYEIKEDGILPSGRGRYIKISIQDCGAGIEKLISNKVFDPFFTTRPGRKGIGLSIAYSVIKRHEGFIDFIAGETSGTIFRIFLPITQSKRAINRASPKNSTNKNMNILIMDDEDGIRDFITEVFNHLGYDYKLTKNGDETIEVYKESIKNKKYFDCVILDLVIPGGIGGKEVLLKLKELNPNIKAIVSSGYSNDPIMSNYEKSGFQAALAKPYRVEEVTKVLEELYSI